MGELFRRIYYLLHRRRLNAELESDMDFHREMASLHGGAAFGNKLLLREQAQDAWGWTSLDRALQDIHWAVRGLKRAPGSALAMVVLLALGMGGVTALFGPLYSLVLRPLPFPHSDRLVRVGGSGLKIDVYAHPTFFENRRSFDRIFSDLTDYSVGTNTLSGDGPTEVIDVATVTPEFFSTLGVEPRLGTGLPVDMKVSYYNDSSDIPGVIVSDRFWKTRLRSTRALRNCLITLDRNRFAVLGVMPPDFDFPAGVQVWTAGQVQSTQSTQFGRLRAGVSIAQAQAGLTAMESKGKQTPGAPRLTVESLHDYLLGDRKPLLWILSAVSLLFLALACAGVANLLLARGVRRRPEMVVRTVLGAGRVRLIRQLLTETLLLAAAGGLLGLAFSVLARYGLQSFLPEMMKDAASFSPATIALVAALTLLVAILCGIAPAYYATSADLNASLKAGNTASSFSWIRRHRISVHELFAGGQLVLAMVLLISTGLLLRSMRARLDYALGFDPRNLAVVHVDLPNPAASRAVVLDYWHRHSGPRSHADEEVFREATESAEETIVAQHELFYREATRRLKELPEVAAVGVMSVPPFAKGTYDWWQGLGDLDVPSDGGKQRRNGAWGLYRETSAGALPLMGVHFLAGRDFLPEDVPAPGDWKQTSYHFFDNSPRSTLSVIVNETFAHTFWPGQNPLGKMFKSWKGHPARVVGVVADIHESRQNPKILPTLYEPFTASNTGQSVTFIVKLRPGANVADLKNALPPVDADAAPPTAALLQESLGNLPIALALLSCFSVLGIVVAGLGVYATATLMSAARTRENGIRLAIGASAEQVGRMTMWRSLRLALLALPLGALGAWLLGRSLSHWLYKVGATDPPSYLISAAVLLAIALAAGLWPALRAATTDPSTALRDDG